MKRLLRKALANVFDMEKEDAFEIARTVETVFRGKEEIEDMSIDKHVRSLFYELEREKILKMRREEFKEKGTFIRKYYWSFDSKGIKEGAYRTSIEEPYGIYHKIPSKAWLVHTINN
ncbi:MAG: hypothetical protein V1726_02790 [Methanobacteriota archaeon]